MSITRQRHSGPSGLSSDSSHTVITKDTVRARSVSLERTSRAGAFSTLLLRLILPPAASIPLPRVIKHTREMNPFYSVSHLVHGRSFIRLPVRYKEAPVVSPVGSLSSARARKVPQGRGFSRIRCSKWFVSGTGPMSNSERSRLSHRWYCSIASVLLPDTQRANISPRWASSRN